MKKLTMLGFALLAALGCAAAFAQGRGIELEEIENSKPSFYVRVAVNHEDLTYTEDDLIEATVTSSEDGFLYLFYKDADDNVSLLYPNKFHTDNKIEKGKTVTVPEKGGNFRMRVVPPFGKEQLLALVSKKPLENIETKDLGDDYTVVTKSIWDSFRKAVAVEGDKTEDFAEHLLNIKTVGKSDSRAAPQEKRFFLGFGVGSYEDPAINKRALPACPLDVKRMANLFVERCGVSSDNVATFIDEEVTLEMVKKAFCEVLPEITAPGDVIFVYWSGHGGRCADEDGDEKDGNDEYLVPYDAKISDPSTMLLDDVFGRWVQNLDGRKILFIIDACNSAGNATNLKSLADSQQTLKGAFGKDEAKAAPAAVKSLPFDFGFGEVSQIKDLGQKNMAVLASSAADEYSLVREENDMSVMTYYIVEELKSDSGITHVELYELIKPKVVKYAKEKRNIDQTPLFQDEFDAPLILNP